MSAKERVGLEILPFNQSPMLHLGHVDVDHWVAI